MPGLKSCYYHFRLGDKQEGHVCTWTWLSTQFDIVVTTLSLGTVSVLYLHCVHEGPGQLV